MKKLLFCLSFLFLLTAFLASCGGQEGTPSEPTDPAVSGSATEVSTGALTETPTGVPTEPSTEPGTDAPEVFTITFHTGGGSAVAPIRAEKGTQVRAPQAPVLEGKAFVCWCLDAEWTVPAEFPLTMSGNLDLYAKWNTVAPIKEYLKALTDGYQLNPYSYIPEAMRPGGAVTDPARLAADYADFTAISAIPTGGFGEQWHMITDNLNQSMQFFKVLQSVEGVTTTSVAAFNNWFDRNPGSTAHHSFRNDIYNVTIDYDGAILRYVLDYTAAVPLFGEQSIQIAMVMQVQQQEKTVRVQIGDANALTYVMGTDSYSFAIQYLGVRTAYFAVRRAADGSVTGQINEHLTVSGVGTHSAADFFIGDTYVSAVGNKASGIVGFRNYINELYDVKTGRLLGYEVRETRSKITFNTLWVNLSDVSGLQSIKYREKTDDAAAAFFVNGRTEEWENKKIGGIGATMLSRRYDIEMRTQYFYVPAEDGEGYTEVAVRVPMLFVQEEQLGTLTADIAEKNSGLTLRLDADGEALKKVRADYAALIDAFIAHQDAMDEDSIRKLIGSKVTFS